MTAMTLFVVAILVFSLMIAGLYLSIREFLESSDDPSKIEGANRDRVRVKEVQTV